MEAIDFSGGVHPTNWIDRPSSRIINFINIALLPRLWNRIQKEADNLSIEFSQIHCSIRSMFIRNELNGNLTNSEYFATFIFFIA